MDSREKKAVDKTGVPCYINLCPLKTGRAKQQKISEFGLKIV